ncbi:MAG: hypothetical protein WDW36_000102 [Sanguina aurantia]
MGRPVSGPGNGRRIDLSHQEMERLVTELEEMYASQPGEWITVAAIANYLCYDMGYEDMDEFEDALSGTFIEFLQCLPHVETMTDELNRLVYKIKPSPPREEWVPTRMTLSITRPSDLWVVLHKSAEAMAEIPHMEFEISRDGKKHIDSVYNHIAAAIFNLGCYVRSAPLSTDHFGKISETIDQLNRLLDVEEPWELVVHDASGLSAFSREEGVVTEAGLCVGDGGRLVTQAESAAEEEEAGGRKRAAEGDAAAEGEGEGEGGHTRARGGGGGGELGAAGDGEEDVGLSVSVNADGMVQ